MLPARACTFSFITTWFSSPEFLQTDEAIMINIGCSNKRSKHWYQYFISKYISERRDCRDGMRAPGRFEPPTNLGIGRQCSICQHVTHQDINSTHIKTSRHETHLHLHWNVPYPPHFCLGPIGFLDVSITLYGGWGDTVVFAVTQEHSRLWPK